jgi:hypothetical protein
MTIFDSIKYPISNPPTSEDLRNLPPDIYNKWLELWNESARDMLTPVNLAAYYYFLYNDIGNDLEAKELKQIYKIKIDALRLIIHEHDNI